MFVHDFHMLRRMPREHHTRRPPKRTPKKPKQKRVVDPKEFSEVFENPLSSFMPLVEYLSGVRTEEGDEREEREGRRRLDEEHRAREMYEMERRQLYDRGEEEGEGEDGQYELTALARKHPLRTFIDLKEDILKQLITNKERMNSNRKANVDFIETNLSVSLKQYDLLNKEKLQKNWANVESIIKRKLADIEQRFEQMRPLLGKARVFDSVLSSTLNESSRKVKLLRHLNINQQSGIFYLLLNYLALPTLETLHLHINTFERRTREIFQKLSSQEDDLKRVLRNLPYKESSFYWSKIIECCRYISDCDHYRDLDEHRVQSFEAEYAGLVTQDILKRLKEGEWLDNSITSAVIEYLRQVEGGNNYHNDSNLRVCLFTHSETDIFVNNQYNPDNFFAYEKLIFLVNIPNTHWFVITVYNATNEIVVYDSLGTYPDAYKDYSEKIIKKLKRKRPEAEYKLIQSFTPKQNNMSDCGVFSIVNIICAFDKEPNAQRRNVFKEWIIPEIRHSLFLFLLYLGYCKRFQVVPRKDYFDILFRSTINAEMKSKLHQDKRRGR